MSAIVGKVLPLVQQSETKIISGQVAEVVGQEVTVVLAGQQYRATTAFSCLVQPQAGDTVLCAGNDHQWVVLSILERPFSPKTVLQFPGDVVLRAKSASMVTEENLNFFSAREIHKSDAAVVDIKEVTATGETLQATYRSVRLISQLINTMARHVIKRVQTYLRQTEDHDQIKAGQLTRTVEGLYCMDSKHTVMVSKKDTRIDGERIHMG
jgi:hypothetical protein